jgi:hypothetical protein
MRKVLLMVPVLLLGCVHSGVHPLRPQELATAPYRDTEIASLTGSLLYEGGCLLFRDDETKQHYLPVWPVGSEFNGTSVIFHQPAKAEQRVVVGEEFVMTGQPAQWSELAGSYYGRFEQQCGAQPFLVSGVRPAA